MSGSVAFEVGLGLVFTYLVFSSICSGFNEAIARVVNSRGTNLFKTVNALIDDVGLAKAFWSHPLIIGLMRSRATVPDKDILSNTIDRMMTTSAATVPREIRKV